MVSSTRDGDLDHEDEIRMWREGDWWVITDVETGVTTQGETREEALEMLDEAVALYHGETGESIDTPEEEREAIREMGIDPDEVEAAREGNDELPDFMQRRRMRRDLSGREVVKALTKNRFSIADRTRSHVKLRYEHPSNDDDIRVVSVPMHDSIRVGTLRNIAEQSGAEDFEAWCQWIEANC